MHEIFVISLELMFMFRKIDEHEQIGRTAADLLNDGGHAEVGAASRGQHRHVNKQTRSANTNLIAKIFLLVKGAK